MGAQQFDLELIEKLPKAIAEFEAIREDLKKSVEGAEAIDNRCGIPELTKSVNKDAENTELVVNLINVTIDSLQECLRVQKELAVQFGAL